MQVTYNPGRNTSTTLIYKKGTMDQLVTGIGKRYEDLNRMYEENRTDSGSVFINNLNDVFIDVTKSLEKVDVPLEATVTEEWYGLYPRTEAKAREDEAKSFDITYSTRVLLPNITFKYEGKDVGSISVKPTEDGMQLNLSPYVPDPDVTSYLVQALFEVNKQYSDMVMYNGLKLEVHVNNMPFSTGTMNEN